MIHSFKIPQLLLCLALGMGFLSAVSDRLGFLGPFGNPNIEWGNWDSFIQYTGTLMPFLDKPAVTIMGGIAMIAEAVIGILLIIGYKTRMDAISNCLLTLVSALSMMVFLGIKHHTTSPCLLPVPPACCSPSYGCMIGVLTIFKKDQ